MRVAAWVFVAVLLAGSIGLWFADSERVEVSANNSISAYHSKSDVANLGVVEVARLALNLADPYLEPGMRQCYERYLNTANAMQILWDLVSQDLEHWAEGQLKAIGKDLSDRKELYQILRDKTPYYEILAMYYVFWERDWKAYTAGHMGGAKFKALADMRPLCAHKK